MTHAEFKNYTMAPDEYVRAIGNDLLAVCNETTFCGTYKPKVAKDTHTEHCCKNCGCKYGEGRPIESFDSDEAFIPCSVVSGLKQQSYECGKTSVCENKSLD